MASYFTLNEAVAALRIMSQAGLSAAEAAESFKQAMANLSSTLIDTSPLPGILNQMERGVKKIAVPTPPKLPKYRLIRDE